MSGEPNKIRADWQPGGSRTQRRKLPLWISRGPGGHLWTLSDETPQSVAFDPVLPSFVPPSFFFFKCNLSLFPLCND